MTNSQDETEIARLRASAPDYKESMEIGRDWDTTWKNMWPQESDVPGFKNFMLEFYQVGSPAPPVPQPSPETENPTCSRATNYTSASCELSPLDLIYKKTFSKTRLTRRSTTYVCLTIRQLRPAYYARTVKLALALTRITVSPLLEHLIIAHEIHGYSQVL